MSSRLTLIEEMKKPAAILIIFLTTLVSLANLPAAVHAEEKPPSEQIIPKLPTTPDDPILTDAYVYPFWGPVCQRYTYSVIYRDKEGRPPEYVRIYFNGDWIDIEKENPQDDDYQKGVKYIYQFVPTKIGANFYFFEASNGLGKARDGIIDSPDNGPVLFQSAFDNNEITLINATSGEKVWSYSTGKEWVGGVALSDDGKYLAVQTSYHIYLFDTSRREPLWVYQPDMTGTIGGDVKGGIDISADGAKIFAALGSAALLFDRDSGQPTWVANINTSAYNVAISANGNYAAAATAQCDGCETSNALFLWKTDSSEPLWFYEASGNFHDVSLSTDGQFLAAATGCPDRRAYLFSKDSSEPLWQSEMLTRDSPIHRAKISADGLWAAFGAESDDGAIHLYSKNSNEILWKFATPERNSFRALAITPDGNFVGGATTGHGRAFIFAKDSATPLSSWEINASLGAADLADDGSFLAVGGTDNKVHILERESQKERGAIVLNEFVGEIDVSADGRFVAAGTGGSVYFFESLAKADGETECSEIVEPLPQDELVALTGGDERFLDKPESAGRWPGMLFGFGFLGSLFGLGGYLAVVRWQLLRRFRVEEVKLNKVVVILLSLATALFLVLTIVAVVMNRSTVSELDESNGALEQGRCGNTFCEPDFGETHTTCPSDCMPTSPD